MVRGGPSAEVTFELSWAGEELPFVGNAGRARRAAGPCLVCRRNFGRPVWKVGAGAGAGRTVVWDLVGCGEEGF